MGKRAKGTSEDSSGISLLSLTGVVVLSILSWALGAGYRPGFLRKEEVAASVNLKEKVNGSVSGGWALDKNPRELRLWTCDIDVVESRNLSPAEFEEQYRGIKPVIIKGLVKELKWPAREEGRWSRSTLLTKYGDRPVNVAPGAGIVYAGGGQTRSQTFGEFLEGLRTHKKEESQDPSGANFIFDVKFMRKNLELEKDFKTPPHFEGFDNAATLEQGNAWHMLSLGPSRSGLPFHVHGETWLGLVYGSKRWFIYPPGKGPHHTELESAGWHPLLGVLEWFQNILPRLTEISNNKKTHGIETAHEKNFGSGSLLQCVQAPGDVVYLPANWKHATLNIGEAIGVGGQRAYSMEEREVDCRHVLHESPDDVEALHGLALALAHKGIDTLQGEDKKEKAGGRIDSGATTAGMQLLKESEKLFIRAITLRKGQPELSVLLAEVQQYMGVRNKALETARVAAELLDRKNVPLSVSDAALASAQLTVARFLVGASDLRYAEDFLRSGVLKLAGPVPEALLELGTVMAGQERWEEAWAAVAQAAIQAPDSSDVINRVNWLTQRWEDGLKKKQEREERREKRQMQETNEFGPTTPSGSYTS